jgi:hypothetical protein
MTSDAGYAESLQSRLTEMPGLPEDPRIRDFPK